MKIALTIAGSDSGGGAGIQADLKTFHQFGVFGTCVVTAVTAQNTLGVFAIHPIPEETVTAQLKAVVDDLPPDAAKTGMLGTLAIVELVADEIAERRFANYVLDPVMVATSGDRLLDLAAERRFRDSLVPLATLVTPNLAEATILVETTVDTVERMEQAGKALVGMGANAALVKGGHLGDDEIVDVFVTENGTRHFTHEKIDTTSTHGTGCTLSAAVTAQLALGVDLETAAAAAVDFVHRGIATALGVGSGHGPLNHFVRVNPEV